MRRALLLSLPPLLLLIGAPARAAELEPFTRGSFARLQQANAGHPLAVHFWALSCAPCLEELPRWAQLARRHPDFRIVLVNTDPPGAMAQVSRTLDRAGLGRARNMAFAERFAERLRFEVDPDWRGELPRTDLIDAQGAVTPVLGTLTAAEVGRWLQQGGGAAPRAAAPPHH